MLMLCSAIAIADADAAPYGGITKDNTDEKNQKFTVQMSVGQTFTYSDIKTNLDGANYGTITYDWSGTAKTGGITLNGTELSGKFSTAGSYEGVLKATWTGLTAGTDGKKPTQEATQTITFNVDEKITIATTTTAYALVGWDASKTVLTLDCGGSTQYTKTGTEVITDEYKYGDDKSSTNNTHFTADYDASTKKVTVTPTAKLTGESGPEKIYVTLSNPNTGDTQTGEIILYVYNEIAITSTVTHYYTYEGDNTYSAKGFVFSVNYDDDNNDKTVVSEKTMTFGPAGQTVLTADPNSTAEEQAAFNYKHVNISTPFTSVGAITGGDISKDFTATLAVKGKVNNDDARVSEATQTFTLTVYKALAFTSAPAMDGTAVTPTAAGSNSITLSSYISGAKSVKFDWNDGTSTESIVTGTAANYSVNHTYAKAGVYLITISATNDMGTTTSKVMYAVGQDSSVTPDTTTDDTKEDSKGFIEEHGYLFIIFLILAGLLAFVAFYLGYQIPPVLIAIPVCVVLAVLMYFYKDFGGLFDALKGLL